MEFWWVLGIIMWNIFGLFGLCLVMLDVYDSYSEWVWEWDRLNPIYIYRNTNCNILGCILLTLLVNLLCPILSICYWVYKLCTVGRK